MASRTLSDKAEAYLEIRDGQGNPAHQLIEGNHASIGRSSRAQIRLQNNKVSRFHAELFRDPFGRWWVRDLGSRNGIKVNDKRYLEKLLRPGDAIRIYNYTITFSLAAPVPVDPSFHVGTLHVPITGTEPDPQDIQTMRDLDATKLDASHLHKMIEFGNRLLEIDDAEKRLTMLCRLMVRRDFHGRVAAVLRLRKDRPDDPPQMICEVESKHYEREHMPYISRHLLRQVRKTETPALASNVTAGGDVVGLSLAADVTPMSAAAVPLRSNARVMEMLYVVFPPEYGNPEWLALTMLAAKQHQQVESAWVARRQAQQQAVIAGEIERASVLQMNLIPKDAQIEGLDVAVGFEPCRWVGGDYVDAVRCRDGRTFLSVGDVSGKGLQAALITSSLHTMVHSSLRAGMSLSQLFENMNHYLCETLPDQSFVTMIGVMLEPKTGQIEVINCGHPPAMAIDNLGKVRKLQAAANLPLGVDADTPIEIQHETVHENELLAMYSDGLTEMIDDTGKMLGMNRLAEHLSALYTQDLGATAKVMANQLNSLLNRLLGRRMSSDDRTFLLARRVPPGQSPLLTTSMSASNPVAAAAAAAASLSPSGRPKAAVSAAVSAPAALVPAVAAAPAKPAALPPPQVSGDSAILPAIEINLSPAPVAPAANIKASAETLMNQFWR